MIVTALFAVLNYVAKLRILTIVYISLNLVLQALPWCEAFIKSPHIFASADAAYQSMVTFSKDQVRICSFWLKFYINHTATVLQGR